MTDVSDGGSRQGLNDLSMDEIWYGFGSVHLCCHGVVSQGGLYISSRSFLVLQQQCSSPSARAPQDQIPRAFA